MPADLSVRELAVPAGTDSGEPFLSSSDDTVLMSWIGRSAEGVRQVLFSSWTGGRWSEPKVVAEGEGLLVNVADFPSVVAGAGGTLWAHWLDKHAGGTGYGIRVSRSIDGGATWSAPWVPHEDAPAGEHGFVSTVPTAGGAGIVWLDGRGYVAAPGGDPATMETALYYRAAGATGPAGPEMLLDARVCDCCQTDVAVTARGAVLAYRDRSPDEIRDIRVAWMEEDGTWSDGGLVHEDGWETGACPINGPAIAARGEDVAVAWFTAAGGEARVNVAFSTDAARGFRRPVRVDDGAPAGRVDVVLLEDGSALVSWLERTGGDGAEVRLRRVGPGGQRLETVSASGPFTERAGGFPRLARADDGAIIVAWTDGSELIPRVRATLVAVDVSGEAP